MKAVILCGGRGTRLGEHGKTLPKALIPIGGKPIIRHLLEIFARHGVHEFVLCTGYLGDEIQDYFTTVRTPWIVKCVNTGPDTNTGGRLLRAAPELDGEERFFVTYGDGLADVNLTKLHEFHLGHGKTGTVTAVHPHSNFGVMDLDDAGGVVRFREKPRLKEWINGGFFVFESGILECLTDNVVLEREPLEVLSSRGELMAFPHEGFWKCMDTFKDNLEFEELWRNGAPWQVE
jgi:glucose-1-phosphate cytidylyltransferase